MSKKDIFECSENIYAIINGKLSKFSIDRLMKFLSLLENEAKV